VVHDGDAATERRKAAARHWVAARRGAAALGLDSRQLHDAALGRWGRTPAAAQGWMVSSCDGDGAVSIWACSLDGRLQDGLQDMS
jgi:hypothetical protein